MLKPVTILYLVCFACYILFTREPDFFGSDTTLATVHWSKDSASQQIIPKAEFSIIGKQYAIDARYVLRDLKEGKKLEVIYDPAHPEMAAVNSWWGYWIRIGEWTVSFLLLMGLLQIAISVTKNPTPESLIEQLEYVPPVKRKYEEE
jgi:hypothetical protein